jgi:glycosyltransferase involved in cell wall biosynthesis
MPYDISNYLVLYELKNLLLLLLFVLICILWTCVFVVYFKSHSRTPQISSNQFYITIKEIEQRNGKGKKQIQSSTLNDVLPFISVIVPVRNGGKYIQRCLLSLLAQDYPYFEVIVIDDNSTDTTLQAIERIKKGRGTVPYQEIRPLIQVEQEEDNLKILSLARKPDSWAGKTWASEQGYLKSKGSILLFTDGDIYYQRKDVISLTLSYMQRQNLDVLTGIPSSGKIYNFWSKTILPLWELVNVLFGVNNTADVNNPKSKYAYLMGSYFIIKRKVFEDIGTFQSVRAALQEDKALGFRIKEKGYNMKIVRLKGMASELESRGIFDLWYLIGRTVAPLVVKNKVRVAANLIIIFLVSFLPFIILPFTLFFIEGAPALYTAQLFLPNPKFESRYYYQYLILSINIVCCLIVIVTTAIKGILEYRLSPLYSLLSFFGSFFLIVAFAYTILPLLLFGKTRPITWQGRKYVYEKEQEGFSL